MRRWLAVAVIVGCGDMAIQPAPDAEPAPEASVDAPAEAAAVDGQALDVGVDAPAEADASIDAASDALATPCKVGDVVCVGGVIWYCTPSMTWAINDASACP